MFRVAGDETGDELTIMGLKEQLKRILPDRVTFALRRYRLRRELSHFRHRIVEHVYANQPLRVSLRDRVAADWYDRDWGEMPELELLKKSGLRPGARVFDLGAHQGVLALILSKEVGPQGTIVAIEGTEHNVEIARENCRLNTATNVVVEHAVAGEIDGSMIEFSSDLNGAVGRRVGFEKRVRVVSVDGMTQRYGTPDVMFVDVEGYECQVLRGARNTLRRNPDVLVEVHRGCGLEGTGSVEELLSFFPEDQFQLLYSGGEEQPFHRLGRWADLPKRKFFLLALKKMVRPKSEGA